MGSRLTRRAALLTATTGAIQLVMGVGAGCADSTGGQIVDFRTKIRGASNEMTGFENRFGWKIVLTEARFALGRIEFFEEHTGPDDGAEEMATRLSELFVPSAHAHPGHPASGEILAELNHEREVDLMQADPVGTQGRAIAGSLAAARLILEPGHAGTHQTGDGLPSDSALVELAGVAERITPDGGTGEGLMDVRRFTVVVSASDLHRGEAEQEHDEHVDQHVTVDDCEFDGHAELQQDSVVQLTVHPSVWFANVDFSPHGTPNTDTTEPLDVNGEPFVALMAGLRSHEAYVFSQDVDR